MATHLVAFAARIQTARSVTNGCFGRYIEIEKCFVLVEVIAFDERQTLHMGSPRLHSSEQRRSRRVVLDVFIPRRLRQPHIGVSNLAGSVVGTSALRPGRMVNSLIRGERRSTLTPQPIRPGGAGHHDGVGRSREEWFRRLWKLELRRNPRPGYASRNRREHPALSGALFRGSLGQSANALAGWSIRTRSRCRRSSCHGPLILAVRAGLVPARIVLGTTTARAIA